MRQLVLVAAVVVAAVLVIAPTAGARIIASGSASGEFATATAEGSVRHPDTLAIRVRHSQAARVKVGWRVRCTRGVYWAMRFHNNFTVPSGTTVRIWRMRNADKCNVVATVSAIPFATSGTARVAILAT
jgi:hypothetical protein